MASSNNNEKFTFKIGKVELDCNKPGVETRKTLALGGLIILVLLIAAGAIFYFLKLNMLSAGFTGLAALSGFWFGRGGRGP